MNMIRVTSSQIHSVGYEDSTLYVSFHNRGGEITATWAYDEVPMSVYDEMMSSPSTGRYLNDHIKGVFDGRKLS